MKYLGLILDKNGNFKKHLGMMAKRAKTIMSALGRLMPNIGGSREKKRKTTRNSLGPSIWSASLGTSSPLGA